VTMIENSRSSDEAVIDVGAVREVIGASARTSRALEKFARVSDGDDFSGQRCV